MIVATAKHRLLNLLQSALLLAAMALIAWVSIAIVLGPGIGLLAALGAVIGLAFAPDLPSQILLSAYQARPLGRRDAPGLVAAVEGLARRAGLSHVPALYRIPSQLPNAFALGSPAQSTLCVTDGALDLLDGRELVAVLAHEVSHIAHRDLWIMGLADVMSRLVSLASWLGQVLLLINLPLLLAGVAYVPWPVVLLLIFAPTLTGLAQLGLSRTREYDADRAAVELTGDPQGLIRALGKLERRTGWFWEEILLPGRRIPEPSLLRTHPPTERRIARLRELAADTTGIVGAFPDDPLGPSVPAGAAPRFRRFGTYW